MRPHRTILFALLASGGLLATAMPARAQALDDKYWIEIAGYWPDVDSHVRVQSKTFPNVATDIDLESDLDLADRKTLPAIGAGVRLGSHFVIGAEYYALKREGSRSIQRDLVFDDVTYPVGASVSSGFESDIYRLTVGYDFVRNDKFALGAAIGAHITNFDVSLSGQANVGNAGVSTEVRRKEVLAPLPTVGLFGSAKLLPRLTLNGRVDFLQLKIDDYKGRLINAQAALTYRFVKNVGLGIMYRYVDYRLDADKERWEGRLSYRFSGPSVFLQVGF
jgi:hypothetical protein